MEKKYLLVDAEDIGNDLLNNVSDVEIVYSLDNPYKRHLFEAAVKNNKTDIEDQEEFDWDIEIYKILKRCTYLDYDKVKIEILSGWSGEFTKREAEMVCNSLENRITDIDKVLKEVRHLLATNDGKPKIVVYTCITGGYDNILEPSFVTPGVDYICFTDDKTLKSKTWKFRSIPEDLLGYSKVAQQRGVKMLPHKYLNDYDISIYVDGSVVVRGDVKEFLKTLDFDSYSVFISEHPQRKCIYAEKDACVKIKKITGNAVKLAEEQMKRYRSEGFPENFGLVQANIIIRKHNDSYCKMLMEGWWEEFKENAPRDQLSFNYVLWKIGSKRFKYLPKTTCNSKTFNWLKAHKKK